MILTSTNNSFLVLSQKSRTSNGSCKTLNEGFEVFISYRNIVNAQLKAFFCLADHFRSTPKLVKKHSLLYFPDIRKIVKTLKNLYVEISHKTKLACESQSVSYNLNLLTVAYQKNTTLSRVKFIVFLFTA